MTFRIGLNAFSPFRYCHGIFNIHCDIESLSLFRLDIRLVLIKDKTELFIQMNLPLNCY